MKQMTTTRVNDKAITEGYLAGGSALLVTILWIVYSPLHPLIIFILFLVSLFCFSLSTLWLLAKEMTIKEWFKVRSLRYLIVGLLEVILVIAFFTALFAFR